MVISYHSLEDRLVKQQFQRLAREGVLQVLTRKVDASRPMRKLPRTRERAARRCASRRKLMPDPAPAERLAS